MGDAGDTRERHPADSIASASFVKTRPWRAADDAEATRRIPPLDAEGPTAAAPPDAAAGSSEEPAPSPTEETAEVLRLLEAQRSVLFFRLSGVVSMLVLIVLPLLPGDRWLRFATGVQAAAAALICLVMSRVAATPESYTPRRALAAAVSLAVLGTGVIYYLGLFSASVSLLIVGVTFYGTSQNRRVAWSAWLVIAGLYLVGTAGIAVGWIPDLSLFSAEHLETSSRIYRVLMQQAMFGFAFYLARTSRRATHIAMERARHTDLALRQREAQLLEHKVDLDRALRPTDGRHTGLVVGKWRLEALLGRGGMGEVYAATHQDTREAVAVKLLHPAMLEDPTQLERFSREAEAASAVPSAHVARVLEVGTTAEGVPFMVMDRLEGHDLAWHLRRTPQLQLEEVAEMVEHTARALSAVRDAGIVHRDLKPGNVFLEDSLPRRWKVLDFGLSKLQGNSSLTKDNALGTPAYMAPEQIRDAGGVDHLADLYALTAIAYRALTGRAPFVGERIARVLMDALTKMPESPSAFVRLPMDVELVLAIGLAKAKGDRFRLVEDLARALRQAARGELDPAIREKGWAILRLTPWGVVIPGAMRPTTSPRDRPA